MALAKMINQVCRLNPDCGIQGKSTARSNR